MSPNLNDSAQKEGGKKGEVYMNGLTQAVIKHSKYVMVSRLFT